MEGYKLLARPALGMPVAIAPRLGSVVGDLLSVLDVGQEAFETYQALEEQESLEERERLRRETERLRLEAERLRQQAATRQAGISQTTWLVLGGGALLVAGTVAVIALA